MKVWSVWGGPQIVNAPTGFTNYQHACLCLWKLEMWTLRGGSQFVNPSGGLTICERFRRVHNYHHICFMWTPQGGSHWPPSEGSQFDVQLWTPQGGSQVGWEGGSHKVSGELCLKMSLKFVRTYKNQKERKLWSFEIYVCFTFSKMAKSASSDLGRKS